jgi:arylsulfatase A-like enzyme
MTGCYPKRALPIEHVLFPVSAVGLHPDEVTIAELLKERGYATACIGKWHLGDQPPFLPTRQGFDEYFGLPYSNDMGTGQDGAKSNFGEPLPAPRANPRAPMNDETGLRTNQPPLPLLENTEVLKAVGPEEQQAITRLYTEKAVEFITQHRDEPFFLYLPHSAVHFPLYPREDFRGTSKNGLFGDWVQEMDWSIGQVLDRVRQLNLGERTLVIFTSDNGGAIRHGSNNSPLRGAKGQTYEGGLRVPTIAWWPGRIPAETQTDAITSMMDLLPTLVTLSGGKLPTDRKLDGVDIWPVLSDLEVLHPPRYAFHYFRGLQLEAVRSGPWKLHLAKSELYHLGDDIAESRNIAPEHPEVVKSLWEMAINVDRDLGRAGVGPGCRPLGHVDAPAPLIRE